MKEFRKIKGVLPNQIYKMLIHQIDLSKCMFTSSVELTIDFASSFTFTTTSSALPHSTTYKPMITPIAPSKLSSYNKLRKHHVTIYYHTDPTFSIFLCHCSTPIRFCSFTLLYRISNSCNSL